MEEKNVLTGKRLKQCRTSANETLEEIGILIGVHKTTVRRKIECIFKLEYGHLLI